MIVFTKDDLAAKNEIIAKFQSGEVSEALFKQLKALNEKEAAASKAREEEVGKAMKSLAGLNLSFPEFMKAQGENPIFTPSEIMAYAAETGWRFPMGGKASSKAHDDGATKTRKPRTVKEGLVMFEIQPPNAKGGATKIMKGEAFPQSIGAKLIYLASKEGDLATNLMAYKAKNPEVDAYLSTKEGKEEVARWVEWIKKNAPQPTAKQSAKAPAQAQA